MKGKHSLWVNGANEKGQKEAKKGKGKGKWVESGG